MSEMAYQQAVAWLDSSLHFGMKPGLNRIRVLMEHLDHPERDLSIIHVAGTNGKGSVCRYLSSILIKEGYQVGLFTSPHLQTVRERFCINESLISRKDFTKMIGSLKDAVEHLNSETDQPTYFELCTALAFLFFQKQNINYAIVEVGLGGRYDATNIVSPILSIITNISFDHQQSLGTSIEEIAAEKAGIIKDCVTVITAAKNEALIIIGKQAVNHNAQLVIVDDHSSSIIERTVDHQSIRIQGVFDEYILETHEIGGYQKQNLSVAIHAIEQLQMRGVFVSTESIQDGVRDMVHQGRMKIIHDDPLVIIDGAHNPDGVAELHLTIASLFPEKNIICIFGVLKDKKIHDMIQVIHSFCQSIIITKPTCDRAVDPEDVKDIFESFGKKVFVTANVEQAIQKGLQLTQKDDLILVTGSLYLIRDVLSYFKYHNKQMSND